MELFSMSQWRLVSSPAGKLLCLWNDKTNRDIARMTIPIFVQRLGSYKPLSPISCHTHRPTYQWYFKSDRAGSYRKYLYLHYPTPLSPTRGVQKQFLGSLPSIHCFIRFFANFYPFKRDFWGSFFVPWNLSSLFADYPLSFASPSVWPDWAIFESSGWQIFYKSSPII